MKLSAPTELIWALIGLILTISGTFVEAFTTNPPWSWGSEGLQARSLGVTFQVGAVLLVGCMGGRRAGLISQASYLLLGLTWLNVFTNGGGFAYISRPYFGYLLGFVPGAWLCGWLALKLQPKLENLAVSCLSGLTIIHLTGIGYFTIGRLLNWFDFAQLPFWSQVMQYTIAPFPGQLAVVCAVTVIAFILRHLLLY